MVILIIIQVKKLVSQDNFPVWLPKTIYCIYNKEKLSRKKLFLFLKTIKMILIIMGLFILENNKVKHHSYWREILWTQKKNLKG